MPAPVLNQLALDHAREKVCYLSTRADALAVQLRDLDEAIADTHRALREAAEALRARREVADVPAGTE